MFQRGLEQGLDITMAKDPEKTSGVSRHFVLLLKKKALSIILISRCCDLEIEKEGNMSLFVHVF